MVAAVQERECPGDAVSRIVLATADGLSNTAIADKLDIHVSSARKWRTRFVADRLEGLLDEPRPGRPRVVGDDRIEALIVATLETAPADATHWSTRSMAEHLGLNQSMVSRVWRAFGLAPHKQDSWKLVQGSVVRSQGSRRRRAVSEPARACVGAVRGREDPDPSLEQNPAGVADAAGHSRPCRCRVRA